MQLLCDIENTFPASELVLKSFAVKTLFIELGMGEVVGKDCT